MNSKDIQRGWRKVTKAVAAFNIPKCSQNCGRAAVRETSGFGPVCAQCYRTLDVILNGKPRRTTSRKKR
jgi:hypothetical protein